jgi:K+-transporting ATPase ATPase C chain
MKFAVNYLRQVWAGLAVLLALTVILGIGYPAAVWGVSRLGAPAAEGSPLRDSAGCVVGSSLLGVDPQVKPDGPDPFFHTRVVGSVSESNAMAPGDPAAGLPSNLGPSSTTLADFTTQRRILIGAREGVPPSAVPTDAATGSGSGLDPQISPAYAELQVSRVARENAVSPDRVRQLVAENTAGRQLGFLGAERVNVTALNVALGLRAPSCAMARRCTSSTSLR